MAPNAISVRRDRAIHLGHNVGCIFMMVFGVGIALAAVAGVIAGPALVTQSDMATLLGPILFVVVVVADSAGCRAPSSARS